MELVAIVLSVPAAFIVGLVYCFLLGKVAVRAGSLERAIWGVSIGVLLVWVVEIVLLVTIGAVRSRALIGPAFYGAHVACFFIGTPALANVLLLWPPRGVLRWFWAALICTVFAVGSVLLQYSVSEALYGVEGIGVHSVSGSGSTAADGR